MNARGRCGDGVYSAGFERGVGELCEFAGGLLDGDVRGADEWGEVGAEAAVDIGVGHCREDGGEVSEGVAEDGERLGVDHFDGYELELGDGKLMMLELGKDGDWGE